MGARISQTNVYAISSIVSASEWDVENILRRFEKRPSKYKTVYHFRQGDENHPDLYVPIELVPHYANPAAPDFLIAEDDNYGNDIMEPIEQNAVATEDVHSVVQSLPHSPTNSVEGIGKSIAGQTISPLPSFIEGGIDNDETADLNFQAKPEPNVVNDKEGGSVLSDRSRFPANYNISREGLQELLELQNMNESDRVLLNQMFSLVDCRGCGETDLRELLLPFCLVVAKTSIRQFLTMLFRTFDRAENYAVERTQLVRIFTLVNEALFYFGDRPLEHKYVRDVVDSIFTVDGKIDGYINWRDYMSLIESHPIIEMLFSPQYQGLARDKCFDQFTLADMKVSAAFDYS